MRADNRVDNTPPFAWLTVGNEWSGPNATSGISYASDFWDASIEQLNLSGTGEEELVFEAIAKYLRGLTGEPALTLHSYSDADKPLMAMAAELASNADFVEYGVALRCAWITDAGRAWLADYAATPGLTTC